MIEPTERDANRKAADRLWNGIVRWSGIYEAIATAREEGRREERERCARRVEQFFAPCSASLERRYGIELAARIRSGE